jgi:hypothetical protein
MNKTKIVRTRWKAPHLDALGYEYVEMPIDYDPERVIEEDLQHDNTLRGIRAGSAEANALDDTVCRVGR